jgi:hypothetical protein
MHASTPTGTGDREPRRSLGGLPGSELPSERFFCEQKKEECPVSRKHFIANAILWAVAIIASAAVGAPRFLSGVLLPALAAAALLVTWPKSRT